MSRKYTQLTPEERYYLYTMSKQLTSLREIANDMDRTLSRELRRNTGQKSFCHPQAQHLAEQRHQEKPKAVKLTKSLLGAIHEKLQAWWSPEQISGRLHLEQGVSVSLETIYRVGLKDKTARGAALSRLASPSEIP